MFYKTFIVSLALNFNAKNEVKLKANDLEFINNAKD